MTDTDQEREDEVLRRMLKTKPKPHKSQQPTREKRDESDQSSTRVRNR